jgi:DNA polymerase-3 subunit gamma/tau
VVQPAPTPAEAADPVQAVRAEPVGGPACAEEIPRQWQQLVEFVSKKRPSLGSVLSHACPREVSGTRIRIALESGSFFADQMKSSRNRQDLAKFCAEVFGQQPELVVEEIKAGEGMTLARSQEIQDREQREKDREQALTHPMVQEAIRVFGAEVDQVQTPGRKEP